MTFGMGNWNDCFRLLDTGIWKDRLQRKSEIIFFKGFKTDS